MKSGLIRYALLILMCAAFSIPLAAQVENPATLCSLKNQKNSAKVDRFVFRTYQSEDGACLQVLHGSKVIFRRTIDSSQGYTLGQAENKEWDIPAIANGTDITGRSHPDMIVSYYTGGAHCCMFHYVFELEPKFRLLATLDDADDDLAHFVFDPEDRQYYLLTADWVFAYWPGNFASSPSHSVLLRYIEDEKGKGGYHLALDKMRRPAPTAEEWQASLEAVNKDLAEGASVSDLAVSLWNPALDLIYTGHPDLAWKFVQEAGPRAQEGNYLTLEGFCSTLKQSHYWTDLSTTIRNAPPVCEPKISNPSNNSDSGSKAVESKLNRSESDAISQHPEPPPENRSTHTNSLCVAPASPEPPQRCAPGLCGSGKLTIYMERNSCPRHLRSS